MTFSEDFLQTKHSHAIIHSCILPDLIPTSFFLNLARATVMALEGLSKRCSLVLALILDLSLMVAVVVAAAVVVAVSSTSSVASSSSSIPQLAFWAQ